MTWTEKANEIADGLLKELAQHPTQEQIHKALAAAAMRGIQFECTNWVRQNK